jgi:hypothetical protein
MPKFRKGEFSGPPPVPGDDHGVIERWVAESVMPSVAPMVTAIDALICSTIPNLQYAIKWTKAHYGLEDHGWIIEVAAFHKSVNVVFFGGVDLDPPPPLGEMGRSRYVKLHSLDEVDDPQLASWITQAARTPGWR